MKAIVVQFVKVWLVTFALMISSASLIWMNYLRLFVLNNDIASLLMFIRLVAFGVSLGCIFVIFGFREKMAIVSFGRKVVWSCAASVAVIFLNWSYLMYYTSAT